MGCLIFNVAAILNSTLLNSFSNVSTRNLVHEIYCLWPKFSLCDSGQLTKRSKAELNLESLFAYLLSSSVIKYTFLTWRHKILCIAKTFQPRS